MVILEKTMSNVLIVFTEEHLLENARPCFAGTLLFCPGL